MIMDILIICLLILAAVVLFLIELFIVPGISIAGILAGVCAVLGNYYAFTYVGTNAGILTLVATALVSIGSLVWFMRSKTLDKLSLKTDINGQVDRSAEQSIHPGDTGRTTTRLALIGYADIEGRIVEVKSTGEYMRENTPVRVVRIVDGTVLVEKMKDEEPFFVQDEEFAQKTAGS